MTTVTMKIDLLSENGTYAPGDTLKGSVNVTVKERVIISRISVTLLGVGVVRYVSRDEGDQPRLFSVRKETYVEEEICLYSFTVGDPQDLYTEIGNHSWPFTFVFPENIPSSLESKEGYIRYTISSTFEGHNLPLLLAKTHLSMNALLDLNKLPKAQYPSTAVLEKKSSKLCCFANTVLRVGVYTSRRGYVAGEVITLNAEIRNFDSKPVVSVKAQLVQIIKYHHKTWPRKVKRPAAEIARGYVLPNESQYWMDEALVIPAVVCSYLHNSNLIDVKYKIYFRIAKANMPDVVLKLPIIIGNVPLMGCIDLLSDSNALNYQSVETLERANVCHEQCYFGPHDVAEPDNRNSREQYLFSPKYTTYSS